MAQYKRMAVRILLGMSVAWVGWGLYKPMVDWKRATQTARKQAEEAHNDCLSENALSLKSFEDTSDTTRLGIYGSAPIFVDCAKRERTLVARYQQMTAQDYRGIYRETGVLRIAGYCLAPPAAGFLLLLLSLAGARWVVWYLNH